MRRMLTLCVSTLIGAAAPALAASAPHPLRPSTLEAPPPVEKAAPVAPAPSSGPGTTPAPPAARSPAQLAAAERMRACGREWRANRAKLKADGLTWPRFAAQCRAQLKSTGR